MRMHSLVKLDDVIYWQKIGVDDEGDSLFDIPIVIKCRWDVVNTSTQTDDNAVITETSTNTVYPDRVLVVGGYLMLGDLGVLDALTEEQQKNPKLLRDARSIKSQSTVFEFRWQQTLTKPGYQSDHLTIECQI